MAKKRSKRYQEAAKLIQKEKLYSVEEGIEILKTLPKVKFDQSVEFHCILGLDPRKADQQIRGTVMLPHGTGKTKRVLAFVSADKEKEAKEAGADVIGNEETANQIIKGWLEFDAVVATPDMMKVVGKLGKILGPRGMMPSPKNGTVTPDAAAAIKEIKAGRLEYRLDKNAIVHTIIGKETFDNTKLIENFRTMFSTILKAKPVAAKGQYVKSVAIATSMNPGIKLDINSCRKLSEGV
ncbi:MAG: 50S ribosomal protein L1 [Candidatus Muiribacteriota bacterium]